MEDRRSSPRFHELEAAEIDAILARNQVGRIGYSRENRVEILPIHYVYSEGWIYGRTSHSALFASLGRTAYQWWPVAFQVDEVEALFQWRSVLVHGGLYLIRDDAHSAERDVWTKAVELLRTVVPEALQDGDPVPFRSALFRIAVQERSGREAVPHDQAG